MWRRVPVAWVPDEVVTCLRCGIDDALAAAPFEDPAWLDVWTAVGLSRAPEPPTDPEVVVYEWLVNLTREEMRSGAILARPELVTAAQEREGEWRRRSFERTLEQTTNSPAHRATLTHASEIAGEREIPQWNGDTRARHQEPPTRVRAPTAKRRAAPADPKPRAKTSGTGRTELYISTSDIGRPAPQPFGVSHDGAERLVAAWMRYLGVDDATVTRVSADGGIDVSSATVVAQVKNYIKTVAIVDIRALYGVAVAEGKRAMLFTSGSVSREGASFCDRTKIAVVKYNAVTGQIEGINRLGILAVRSGIPTMLSAD